MKRMWWVCVLVFVLVLGWTIAYAGDFYVIPTQKKNFAPVPKTGQTTSSSTGDDGELQKGVDWPVPRFTDNGNGTVTDKLTGLIWLKDGSSFGTSTWTEALGECNCLKDDGSVLTDGSAEGDWRLPNIRELYSLVDISRYSPALPAEHHFTNVASSYYWSSSTCAGHPDGAWLVGYGYKTYGYYVRCVRSGR